MADSTWSVIVQHWNESLAGEETHGPEVVMARTTNPALAETLAEKLRVERVELAGGGAYGTQAYTRKEDRP